MPQPHTGIPSEVIAAREQGCRGVIVEPEDASSLVETFTWVPDQDTWRREWVAGEAWSIEPHDGSVVCAELYCDEAGEWSAGASFRAEHPRFAQWHRETFEQAKEAAEEQRLQYLEWCAMEGRDPLDVLGVPVRCDRVVHLRLQESDQGVELVEAQVRAAGESPPEPAAPAALAAEIRELLLIGDGDGEIALPCPTVEEIRSDLQASGRLLEVTQIEEADLPSWRLVVRLPLLRSAEHVAQEVQRRAVMDLVARES